MKKKFSIKCECGKYEAIFDNGGIAESSALMHIELGKGHVVTCTETTQGKSGYRIAFVANPEKSPKVLSFSKY